MSKLPVKIDYIKLAVQVKGIKHLLQNIANELDRAAMDADHIPKERRKKDRRDYASG